MPAGGGVQLGSSWPFVSVATIANAKAIAAIAVRLPNAADDQRVLFRTSDVICGDGLRITGDRVKRPSIEGPAPPIYPCRRCGETSGDESAYFYEAPGT